MEDLFDIALDLKTTSMEAAQTVKLMDLIRIKPLGEKTAVTLEAAGVDKTLGHALLSQKRNQTNLFYCIKHWLGIKSLIQ